MRSLGGEISLITGSCTYSATFPIGVGGLLRFRRVEMMCSASVILPPLYLEAHGEEALHLALPDRGEDADCAQDADRRA